MTTRKTATDGGNDVGQDQVQEAVDAETAAGFRGTKVDPTPDENYTVPGVLAGKPTPETDADHAEKVRTATRNSDLGRG